MIAKGHGVTEDEIRVELDNIKKGELWVGFDNMPKLGNAKMGKNS